MLVFWMLGTSKKSDKNPEKINLAPGERVVRVVLHSRAPSPPDLPPTLELTLCDATSGALLSSCSRAFRHPAFLGTVSPGPLPFVSALALYATDARG